VDDLDSKKFINQPENLRLQYSQIMENHRLHHRGSISLILMYLTINGLSIKVVTGDGYRPFMVTLIIICNIALGIFAGIVGILFIRYILEQQRNVEIISENLGLLPDRTLILTLRTAQLAILCGLLSVFVWIFVLIKTV